MGIVPTAPKYARFSVKPQPGNCTDVAITIPTLSGPITTAFKVHPGHNFAVTLTPPANTIAEVCLPKGIPPRNNRQELLVDNALALGYFKGDYICVSDIGSGHRVLTRL